MISRDITLEFYFEDKYMKVTGNGETDFNLISISGIDTIEMERQTSSSPFEDGAYVVNSRALPREIPLTIFTLESKREFVMDLMNSNEKALLVVTRNGIARQINYMVESTESPPVHIYPNIYFDLKLICFDPWFRSIDSFGKNLAQVQPLHGFPLLWLVDKKYSVERKTTSTMTGLVNNGHHRTPFVCRIKARDTVINPSIFTTLKTGEVLTIKVNITLEDGEFIDIISHDYPPENIDVPLLSKNQTAVTVILNGKEDILDNTDLRSTTFFYLERGINQFEYTADGGISYMNVYPVFRGRFKGV